MSYNYKAKRNFRNPNILQIVESVQETICKKQLVECSTNLLLSISGGQDSIFLLFCLSFLQTQINFAFKAFWCNHFWQFDSFYTTLHLTKYAVNCSFPLISFIPLRTKLVHTNLRFVRTFGACEVSLCMHRRCVQIEDLYVPADAPLGATYRSLSLKTKPLRTVQYKAGTNPACATEVQANPVCTEGAKGEQSFAKNVALCLLLHRRCKDRARQPRFLQSFPRSWRALHRLTKLTYKSSIFTHVRASPEGVCTTFVRAKGEAELCKERAFAKNVVHTKAVQTPSGDARTCVKIEDLYVSFVREQSFLSVTEWKQSKASHTPKVRTNRRFVCTSFVSKVCKQNIENRKSLDVGSTRTRWVLQNKPCTFFAKQSFACTSGAQPSIYKKIDRSLKAHTKLRFVKSTFFTNPVCTEGAKGKRSFTTALQTEGLYCRKDSAVHQRCKQSSALQRTCNVLFNKEKNSYRYKRFIQLFSEGLARNWRHIATERSCTFYSLEKIIYGHTLSDRIETIIFNLIRGAGNKGVTPLLWERKLSKFSYNKFYSSFELVKKNTHVHTNL